MPLPALPSELNVYLPVLPANLDPSKIYTLTEWTLIYNLSRTLIGGGISGEITPGLAKSWKVDTKNKSIEFHLDEIHSSNGRLLEAQDVIETFNYILKMDGNTKLHIRDIFNICGKELCKNAIVSSNLGKTITFNLTVNPYFVIPFLTLPDFSILPKEVLLNTRKEFGLYSITTGPYFISNFNENRITLKKNPFSNEISNINFDSINIIDLNKNNYNSIFKNASFSVVRYPSFYDFETQSNEKCYKSGYFWSRLAGVSKKSILNKDHVLRRNIKIEIRKILQTAGVSSSFNWLPPITKIELETARDSGINKYKLVKKILISTFSYTKEQLAEIKKSLKITFVEAEIVALENTSDYVNLVKSGNYDIALGQMSFGSPDPAESMSYILKLYRTDSSESHQFIESVKASISLSDRRSRINSFMSVLEKESIVFGLGAYAAKFCSTADVKIDQKALINGELSFLEFTKPELSK